MKVEQLKEVVTRHKRYMDIDSRVHLEDMVTLVEDLLKAELEDLKENEPSAVVSIRQTAEAIQGVRDLYNMIESMETEDIAKAGIWD